MPNWCTNAIKLSHKNPDMILAAEAAADNGKLLEWLRPLPNGEYDREWCVENWGTKWDLNIGWSNTSIDEQWSVLELNVDSAWSPPIAALEWARDELGFEIELYYLETGMAFMGYMVGHYGQHWPTPQTPEEAAEMLKILPRDMISALDLEREFEFWFEENE